MSASSSSSSFNPGNPAKRLPPRGDEPGVHQGPKKARTRSSPSSKKTDDLSQQTFPLMDDIPDKPLQTQKKTTRLKEIIKEKDQQILEMQNLLDSTPRVEKKPVTLHGKELKLYRKIKSGTFNENKDELKTDKKTLVYRGATNNGIPHGHGTYYYENGDVYEGEWKNGQRAGQGVLTRLNGEQYEGEWKNDEMHGHGRMLYANQDMFLGDWVANKKHGVGMMEYHDGRTYDGEWKNDQPNGLGTMKDKNHIYRGSVVNGQRNGQGSMKYSSGALYEGGWKDNQQHGYGILIKDDTISGSRYIQNKLVGVRDYTTPNGKTVQTVMIGDDFHELKSLSPEDIQKFLNTTGVVDDDALSMAPLSVPVPVNTGTLNDLINYIDSVMLDEVTYPDNRSRLIQLIETLNDTPQTSDSPMKQTIQSHLWGIMDIFDTVDLSQDFKRSFVNKLIDLSSFTSTLEEIHSTVIAEYRQLIIPDNDYKQAVLRAYERSKIHIISTIDPNGSEEEVLKAMDDAPFANAVEVHLSKELGLDVEMALERSKNLLIDDNVVIESIKRETYEIFLILFTADEIINSIWRTLNSYTKQNGEICHLDGLRDCIKNYLIKLDAFAKPGTLDELLSPNHPLAVVAESCLVDDHHETIESLYQSALKTYVNTNYFEGGNTPETTQKINRAGVNFVLKVMGILA